MNKKLLSLILMIVCVGLYAADTRVTELDALGEAPVAADVLLLHDTSASYDKKVTAANLASYIGQEIQDEDLTFTDVNIDAQGGTNNISNIDNDDIKAAAAIAVNKLAALTASRVVVTDGSGFISADGTTTTELQKLDGCTSSTAELNILTGCTATAAELNILDDCTSSTAELNILDGCTATAAELSCLSGAPATLTGSDFNILDYGTSTEAIGDAGAALAFAVGGSSQWTMTAAGLIPAADDSEDIGSATNEIDDFWCDGIAHIDQFNDNTDFEAGNYTFNNNSGDYDFKVETDASASALTVDGGLNYVGFNAGLALDTGGINTFGSGDATPDISAGVLWQTSGDDGTITNFDCGANPPRQGQIIIIISQDEAQYDVSGTNLKGGSTDITGVESGDVLIWVYEDQYWYLITFINQSNNYSTGT